VLTLGNEKYTAQQVKDALHGKYTSPVFKFRYDLLDKNEVKKAVLTNVISGEIEMSSLADIKRTAKFRIEDVGNIDFLSDRIQPFALLRMSDGGFYEFPLGVFLLSTPTRKDEGGRIYRDIEAYDGLVILRDDKFDSRYVISAGTKYYDAIKTLLNGAGVTKLNIEQSDLTLPNAVDFEAGKEKLFAINELLRQINYTPIHVDVNGFYTSFPYRSPSLRAAEYLYKDDSLSVTYNGMEEELDLFNVPNKWVVVRTNAEETPLYSVYTNTNANSVTSTVSRGRTIVDYREIDNIAGQSSLDSYVERIAFEASQIYGRLTFETGLMPFHDYADVLDIDYSPLGIRDKYAEVSWTLPLDINGRMKHEVRKVVSI
jgi:hypothetical protein